MTASNTSPTASHVRAWRVFLVRACVMSVCSMSVAPAGAQSAFVDGERARLHAHFDEVLAELDAADTSALTEDQRVRRAEHLVRLAEYRDRGVFPLRYGGPDGRVPEFRDVHGTRCAMGELIYLSGEHQLVDDVATTANSATIAELSADPRLVQWLDENGLTVEEAGRVQPSYAPWQPTECLCVGSTSLWRGAVRTVTAGDSWGDSESGYNEYTAEVVLVEHLRGADDRELGWPVTVATWSGIGANEPVLVAFDSEGRGWAFPTDEAFEMTACAIERYAYDPDVLVTCENPVAVSLDKALDAMELPASQCEAALQTVESDPQVDLAPCAKDGGCTVGAPSGTSIPALTLLALLAVVLTRRRPTPRR